MPATQISYGFIPGQLVLLVAIAVGAGLFLRDALSLYRLMRVGGPAHRTDRPLERTRGWILNVLGQGRLLTRPYPGIMHALIFWGFVVITFSTVEQLGRGLWADFRLPVIGGSAPFLFAVDAFQLFVLVGVAMAFYRRIRVRPWYLNLTGDAILILSLISTLMVTAFLTEGFGIAAFPESGSQWQVFGTALANALAPLGFDVNRAGHVVSWWAHILTVLGFLAYLPHSKHLHIVTAPFNAWLRNLAPKGQLPYINVEEALEQEKPVGVSEIPHLSWKDILDTYTCTECGRCTSECPASITDKPLSPKDLILDLRRHVLAHGPALRFGQANGDADGAAGSGERAQRMVGDVITDDVLWDCTTCRACVDACPVFIDHVSKIVQMRRHLVMEESRIGKDLQTLFENLDATGNPWRLPRARRADWASAVGVPTLEEAPGADVLYWVGCFGAYDDRAKKVAGAFARLLQRAGVRFAILGPAETCTGDPARRAGNEYLYQTLAQQNVETLNAAKEAGIKTIVTACPHCFNTISDEYPQLGGSFRVMHHTQLLDALVREGRLRPEAAREEAIAYHDPCYLGRYHSTYDEPRHVLASVPGVELREIHPCREKAMCCGAGGAHAFMEEKRGRRINHVRLEQAMAVGPQRIATACPYCMMMFEDATSTKGVAEQLPVQDVAELLEASVR
ncbi:MAG: 4Fe-4S dicluster domain-containing protein [Chloroflexi bacterium]|nr:4Fe-4S dicluster domain-containing protein [Chloroflexota bacterium]